jgi:hypothetical protein
MGEKRNAQRVPMGKPERKRVFGRLDVGRRIMLKES